MQEVKKITDKYGKDQPELCEAVCRARAFNYYDYRMFQGMAAKSGNTLYVLTINGLRKIYTRVGGYYFMSKEACELALSFYRDMKSYCDNNQPELVADRIKKNMVVRVGRFGIAIALRLLATCTKKSSKRQRREASLVS